MRKWVILSLSVGWLGFVLAVQTGCEADREDPGDDVHAGMSHSTDCRSCHEEIFAKWEKSHHALANRDVDWEMDEKPFRAGEIGHGAGAATVTMLEDEHGVFQFETTGPAVQAGKPVSPDMVIGLTPLIQYLIDVGQGRRQTTELAWDPENEEWFNVYGQDNRDPNEWGSWQGRAMNWNSMCAECHMTAYAKNYNEDTDSYASAWLEQGVGCIQCHGNVRDCPNDVHDFSINNPGNPLQKDLIVENCAMCHSRRSNLTGNFQPGDRYADHYRLQLPVNEGLYWPDGQIRDEVYVYTSYRMSKMGHAGVRCMDCHDPHSNELILPYENNSLCMRCHGGSETLGAPTINPTAHSFHPADSVGNLCVECHMPETVYMQRDPRRDHGWLSPDPVLTKELGVPNACSKCHEGAGLEWNIEWFEKWYGESEDRKRVRNRSRAVARGYEGDVTAVKDLLEAIPGETNPLWKASLLTLAASLAPGRPDVLAVAREFSGHEEVLLRDAALHALAGGGRPEDRAAVDRGLDDPRRVVRVALAHVELERLQPGDRAFQDFLAYLKFNSDQPLGALGRAEFLMRRGNPGQAVPWLEKAIAWDRYSIPFYHAMAMALNAQGKVQEAVDVLEDSMTVGPDNAETFFMLSLLEAERGNLEEAGQYLAKVVEIEPRHARAWYNLGLFRSQKADLPGAIEAIAEAIRISPDQPDFLYAQATLYARQNDLDTARELARETLRLAPHHTPARQLLQSLGAPR